MLIVLISLIVLMLNNIFNYSKEIVRLKHVRSYFSSLIAWFVQVGSASRTTASVNPRNEDNPSMTRCAIVLRIESDSFPCGM